MHTYLIEMLEYPACHGELEWTIVERTGYRIAAAETTCKACTAIYPVREGIGLFLTPDLPRNDLWEQVDSRLVRHLREHPELERQLLETTLDTLVPADQFFRALVLEARGNFRDARLAEEMASKGLHTPEYATCWKRQVDYVVELLSATSGPIVDLASGRCYLVERLIHALRQPVCQRL